MPQLSKAVSMSINILHPLRFGLELRSSTRWWNG